MISFPSCLEVNSKGHSVFDQPIRAHLQHYPLQPPFGVKICSDICPRILSVRCSEEKMFPEKYPSIFSPQKERLLLIYSPVLVGVFRPFARERKYLMAYKASYQELFDQPEFPILTSGNCTKREYPRIVFYILVLSLAA